MAFSVMVEMLNLTMRKRAAKVVELHHRIAETAVDDGLPY
jgi:hypothetical protein